MAKYNQFILATFLSSVLLRAAVAISRTDFFGEFIENVTPQLVANDDDSSLSIPLEVPYPFFDTPRTTIFVNNNGALTFTNRVILYDQILFPNNPHQLIAPYWADADTRVGGGNVWYMQSTNSALLANATKYIKRGFVTEQDFQPTNLFIATWERVGYFEQKADKTNTFQCILATDSVDLYVIFLYADIQWTTGDTTGGPNNGLGGKPAQVGFNAGDSQNSYSLPGSRTDDIVNIDERSNIGEPGVWVFHVSGPQVRSGGCTNTGAISLILSPSYGNMLGGETISVAGPCFTPDSRIECEFDGIRNSSIYVSTQEVLCVAPQLQRSGRVDFRLVIDGMVIGRTQFTSISIEKAHQVNVTTSTNTLSLSAGNIIHLEWNPLSIFRMNNSVDFRVTISMYGLNVGNRGWELLHIFTSDSPNDGQESLVIPSDLDRSIEILPVVFEVSASVNPGNTVQSGTLYTKLVMSGQKAGRWTSQYYYINSLVASRTGYYLCQSWYETESQNTGMQLLDETTSPCPPQEAQARAPNSGLMEIDYTSFYGNSRYRMQWLSTFHQGASTCFTSGDLRSSLSSSTQECCYDDSGRLLTGSPGGGSVHKVPLAKNRASHFQEDIRPYLLCCTGYAPTCQKYYERRPSDNGTRYQPAVPAWIFGDPHLVTLDGFKYTFNGKGEFTLIKTQNDLFTMQGRMQQFDGVSATVLTAIVANERYSDTVMVTNSRRVIDAYINGERVDLSVIKQQEFNNVTVIRDSNSTISVEFSSGARISTRAENGFLSALAVVLPPSFLGNTKGLLGVYNGNASDDLLPDGGITPLSNDTSPERIHELFGLTWILSGNDRNLFTYLPYTSFSSLHDPDFEPVFTIDIGSADVSMCGGDEFCIFDVVATNDTIIGIATSTLAAVSQIEDTTRMSYPVVCEPPCQNGACVVNNTCHCSDGYSGPQCDRVDNPRSCDLNPCASVESCAVLAGSFVCVQNCTQHSTSPLCNLGSGPCVMNHCNNGGVCRSNNSVSFGFECICPPGYTGRLCDLVESSCTINPCLNGGSCSDSDSSAGFTCECQTGYSGALCQTEGQFTMTTIIIIAACIGGVVSLLLVLVIVIVIIRACTKSNNKDSVDIEILQGDLKSSTLPKESPDGDQRVQNGTPSFPSREGSSTPTTNGVAQHNGGQPMNHHLPPPSSHAGHQSPTYHYNSVGSTEHMYQELEQEHDQTPPPPYPDYEEPNWPDNNNHSNNTNLPYPVQRVQSESSSINRVSNSVPNSSRSNTTSPNHSNHSTKSSIERAESLQKDSLSNRSLLTPSPVGSGSGMHQSHSHQSIPMRSTASTPAGYQSIKKNLSNTLPHHGMSGQYLSSSTSQISKMRRHSSGAYQTSITDDGSGNLTSVTEV